MALIYERNLWPRQYFDPACPSGGSWYACSTGSRFVGCCTGSIDPCNATTSCPQKNLKPASFNASDYGTFPDQTCDSGSKWFTCGSTDPPFMGCCKSNPCGGGCPASNLTAGVLSSDEASAAPFTITTSVTFAAVTSTSLDSAAATTAAATTTAPASASSSAASSTETDSTGAIAGGVVGGLAGLALILIGVLWWLKRVKQSRKRQTEDYKMEPAYSEGYSQAPSQGHSSQGPPATVYSQESPEGIEVDNRREQPAATDAYLSVSSQGRDATRATSRSSNWPFRSSIPNFGPMLPDDQQLRASWYESPPQWPPNIDVHSPVLPMNNLPFAESPVITPLQGSPPDQADYFGAYATEMAKRQRPVSYELSGERVKSFMEKRPQSPTSPQTQYFELDDTQRSPPVEMDAAERVSKNEGPATMVHTPEQTHHIEAEETYGSMPYSPDDVGTHRQSRDV